jgi:hypothetical protein
VDDVTGATLANAAQSAIKFLYLHEALKLVK